MTDANDAYFHFQGFGLAVNANTALFYMVPTVRGSQGKSKYQDAKVKKNAEKILNCCTQTAYIGSKFFSARFARKLFEI